MIRCGTEEKMTIDQLIAEPHKRREALVKKGYPEARVTVELTATNHGPEIHANVWCGRGQYHDVAWPHRDDSVTHKLAQIDALIAEAPEKLSAEAYDAWFDMAQLAERAAS